MVMAQINLDSLTSSGGKPKDFYLLEFFRLYEKYWDDMRASQGESTAIDICTGLLIGSCPHKPTRERIWNEYLQVRDTKGKSSITASILASGEIWDYLSNTMEFTEEAYAGA